jgi:hypothetical protein
MPLDEQQAQAAPSAGKALMVRVTLWSAIATGLIALVGGALGFLFAGEDGLISGLLGAAIAFVFSLITLLSITLGSRLSLAGFYGLVLGSWLLKVIVFGAVLVVLRSAEFIHGPTFFFALVAAVIMGLAIDSWAALRARIPVTDR